MTRKEIEKAIYNSFKRCIGKDARDEKTWAFFRKKLKSKLDLGLEVESKYYAQVIHLYLIVKVYSKNHSIILGYCLTDHKREIPPKYLEI